MSSITDSCEYELKLTKLVNSVRKNNLVFKINLEMVDSNRRKLNTYSAEVQELLFKPSSKIFKGVKPVLSEYPDTCGVCCQYRVTRSPRLPINCTHSGKLISLVRDWNSLTNTLNCFPELTSVSPEQTKFWRCWMCFSGHLITSSFLLLFSFLLYRFWSIMIQWHHQSPIGTVESSLLYHIP